MRQDASHNVIQKGILVGSLPKPETDTVPESTKIPAG
jgi:hypothetical protein